MDPLASPTPDPVPAGNLRLFAPRREWPETAEASWSDLMRAAQAGNAGAYHRLLTESSVWLRRYCGRRLPPAMRSAPTEALSEDIGIGDHGEAVLSAHSLEALLRELKPAQSEVIRLVKLQGLSIAEAAVRTGQSISLVKVNIHRGLARLAAIVRGRSDAD